MNKVLYSLRNDRALRLQVTGACAGHGVVERSGRPAHGRNNDVKTKVSGHPAFNWVNLTCLEALTEGHTIV